MPATSVEHLASNSTILRKKEIKSFQKNKELELKLEKEKKKIEELKLKLKEKDEKIKELENQLKYGKKNKEINHLYKSKLGSCKQVRLKKFI